MNHPQKTLPCYLLIMMVGFQALSGFWGGIMLIMYPSGRIAQLPLSFLDKTPFSDFFIPGMILFCFIGLFGSYVFALLLGYNQLPLFNRLNLYSEMQQAWTFSIYFGIVSVLWIDIQIMLIGYRHFIQSFYAMVGAVILILALIPSTHAYYKERRAIR